jgi:hypothetical protein
LTNFVIELLKQLFNTLRVKLIVDYYQKGGYLPATDAQGHAFNLEEFLHTIQKKLEAVKTANPNISNKEALKLVESR